MSGKEDLRVKRTKKALTEAFMKLMCEKSFEDITVNELCDEAGVRRATFYKHYTDKFDFLTAYTCSLRDRFDNVIWKSDASAPTKDYYVAYAKRLVGFISENTVAIENILKSNMFPTLLTIILEQNYRATCERLKASVDAGMKLPASIEIVASMASGAVAAAVYAWFKTGRIKSHEELAGEIGDSIARLIEGK